MSSSTTAVTSPASPATSAPLRAGEWLRVALLGALAAAAVAIVFDLAVGERAVDAAVSLEQARTHEALAVPEPFSRGEQRGGLVAGELLFAAGIGLVLAGCATFLGARARSPRRLWLLLAADGICSVVLVPAVKYPPLPPGVPSALGIAERQAAYLAAVAAGLAGFALAVGAWRAAATHSSASRAGLTALAALAPAAVTFALLPDQRARSTIPGDVLAGFRAASIAGQLLFWLALGLVGARLLRPHES